MAERAPAEHRAQIGAVYTAALADAGYTGRTYITDGRVTIWHEGAVPLDVRWQAVNLGRTAAGLEPCTYEEWLGWCADDRLGATDEQP